MDNYMLLWYIGTDPYGDLGYGKEEETREAEEEDDGRKPIQ